MNLYAYLNSPTKGCYYLTHLQGKKQVVKALAKGHKLVNDGTGCEPRRSDLHVSTPRPRTRMLVVTCLVSVFVFVRDGGFEGVSAVSYPR